MSSGDLPRLLQEWRQAEARWESATAKEQADGSLGRAVVDAWRAYNLAARSFHDDEIILVADERTTYVAVFGPTEEALGWKPDELVGRMVADVTPPDSMATMAASWSEFMARGRLEGSYPLLARDGRRILSTFRARAHHPLPGYHISRLRVLASADPSQQDGEQSAGVPPSA